ncbi:MAG: response regulator transcription factor [Sideroxydans sp.]|nr:response regulator transcription factor [Sideroxydans sp.]
MIRLMIADDHAIVREGLKQLFALVGEITVVGTAVNGGEVLEALHHNAVDLLLLDMTMPGISGVDLITRVKAQNPEQKILVLSMHNEPQIARRALAAGASGYLTKDSDPEILLAAVRKISAGGRYIDASLAEAMVFDTQDSKQQAPHEQLSERELQILKLLVRGDSVNEIADALIISNKTVSTHKSRLMQKLNLSNNAELVRYGVEHALI